jgi:hypothetical protein
MAYPHVEPQDDSAHRTKLAHPLVQPGLHTRFQVLHRGITWQANERPCSLTSHGYVSNSKLAGRTAAVPTSAARQQSSSR